MGNRTSRYIIEPDEEQPENTGCFWNFLSTALVLAIIVVVALVVLIFQDPNTKFNPYPPATLPATVFVPTLDLNPTQTESPTDAFVPPLTTPGIGEHQQTPESTLGALPTPEQISLTPAPGSGAEAEQPTPTEYSFVLQAPPSGIEAELLYPERGCDWTGVGGQVLNLQGKPYTGIAIQIGGYLDGKTVFATTVSGSAAVYGLAGYEFILAEKPLDSEQKLWLRLVDQEGQPLSDQVLFDTYAACNKNLIVINFKQIK